MKALKIIGIIIGVLVGLWLIISLFLPGTVVVERSTVINAPAQTVFDNVNTMKNWEQWSYWMKVDSTNVVTYSGPASGVGSSYSWDGKKVMKGTNTIIESNAPSQLKLDLVFNGQPGGKSEWKFEPEGEGTKVTQTFSTDIGFMQRFGSIFMKKVLGGAFEEDLKGLKELSESQPAAPSVSIEQVEAPQQWVIAIRDTATTAEMFTSFGNIYDRLGKYLATYKITPGYGLAVWYKADKAADQYEFEAGFPIADSVAVEKGMRVFKIGGGKTLKTTHWGDYSGLESAHEAIDAHVQQNNVTITGAPWEVYIVTPQTEKDSTKWQTEIYYPVN